MAIHKIKTTVNATVVADKSHDTWLVTDSGRVDAIGVGINADGPQKGREIIVEGEVYGTSWGITFGDMTAEGGGRSWSRRAASSARSMARFCLEAMISRSSTTAPSAARRVFTRWASASK